MIGTRRMLIAIIMGGIATSSCNKEGSIPLGPDNTTSLPNYRQRLHGIWRNVTPISTIPFIQYDSSSSLLSEKRDYGYNFRSELANRAKLDSDRILWSVGDGTYEDWYWYRLNPSGDTLTMSYDSLLQWQERFVRNEAITTLTDWIKTIPTADVTIYPTLTTWVQALTYADAHWYVLTGTGHNDATLHKIPLSNSTVKSYSFPTARAFDIADNYLWIAGKFYLEKRRLSDTTLVARYDLTAHFTSNGGNHWIQGLSVSGTTVLMMTSFERLFILSTDGVVQQIVSSYGGLNDLTMIDNRLWGVTTSGVIHEISPTTFRALHTYYLASPYAGRYQGITVRNGRIACADFVHNQLRIFEVAMP